MLSFEWMLYYSPGRGNLPAGQPSFSVAYCGLVLKDKDEVIAIVGLMYGAFGFQLHWFLEEAPMPLGLYSLGDKSYVLLSFASLY